MKYRRGKYEGMGNTQNESTLAFVKSDALEAAHQLFYGEDIIKRIVAVDTKDDVYKALRDGRERL